VISSFSSSGIALDWIVFGFGSVEYKTTELLKVVSYLVVVV